MKQSFNEREFIVFCFIICQSVGTRFIRTGCTTFKLSLAREARKHGIIQKLTLTRPFRSDWEDLEDTTGCEFPVTLSPIKEEVKKKRR